MRIDGQIFQPVSDNTSFNQILEKSFISCNYFLVFDSFDSILFLKKIQTQVPMRINCN